MGPNQVTMATNSTDNTPEAISTWAVDDIRAWVDRAAERVSMNEEAAASVTPPENVTNANPAFAAIPNPGSRPCRCHR